MVTRSVDVYERAIHGNRQAQVSLDAAEAFVVRLTNMPLAEWHSRAMTNATALRSCGALATLAEATRTPTALYAAWLVRDSIATAMHRFETAEGRRICRRRHARTVRDATECAAVALLVRTSLSAVDFERLTRGFLHAPSADSSTPIMTLSC